MIKIKTEKDLKKYIDKDNNINFEESVKIDINIYSEGDIYSEGNIYSEGDIYSKGNIYSEGDIYSKGNIYSKGYISSEGYIFCADKINAKFKKINGVNTKKYWCITSFKYHISIMDNHIKIGCELHTKTKWKKFTNKDIIAMDGKNALVWWKENKKWILSL
jgi:hypothetical protein